MKSKIYATDIWNLIKIVKTEKIIKVSEISKRLNMSSRMIRKMREIISENPEAWGVIIGENSRDGYYICDNDEKLRQYIADMEARLISFAKQIKQVKEFYNKQYAKEKIEQLELKI